MEEFVRKSNGTRKESLRACCRTLRTDTSSEGRTDGENPKIRSRKQS